MLQRTIPALCIAAMFVAAVVFPARAERTSAPDPKFALAGPALLKALRAGGLTLYFRHTATDFSQNDTRMTTYDACGTQRNLSEEGRRQARAIGESIRALKLPVGEVIANPFCRTMETAKLVFGRATPSSVARGYEGAAPERIDYAPLAALLAKPVKAGELRVIASHGNPFRAVAGPPHLEEGECAVLRPLGNDYAVVARLKRDDWATLGALTPR